MPLPGANWLGTVYHGLPVNALRPSFEPGAYLAFLGRLTPAKGPDVAIRIARAAGMPLCIAAKIPRAEGRYFKEKLEPQIDGDQIKIVGEVDDKAKQKFLADAAALLFPIDWPEPFGLVMIEAMACGTPVIAFRSGSVPEIVDDGLTGFIVEGEEQAVEAIRRLGELDRRKIRARFEQRFTAKRMAEDYLQHYEKLVKAKPQVLKPEPASQRLTATRALRQSSCGRGADGDYQGRQGAPQHADRCQGDKRDRQITKEGRSIGLIHCIVIVSSERKLPSDEAKQGDQGHRSQAQRNEPKLALERRPAKAGADGGLKSIQEREMRRPHDWATQIEPQRAD